MSKPEYSYQPTFHLKHIPSIFLILPLAICMAASAGCYPGPDDQSGSPIKDGLKQAALNISPLPMAYIHQVYDTPNAFNGHWACGPTSAVMALTHFGLLDPWCTTVGIPQSHESCFGRYVSDTYTYNGTTFSQTRLDASYKAASGAYGWIMNAQSLATESGIRSYLEKHGLKAYFDGTPTFAEVSAALDSGQVVILSTSVWSNGVNYGHLMVARGHKDGYKLIVNDPYGNKDTGYMNYNGEGVTYTWSSLNAAWMVVAHASSNPGTCTGTCTKDPGSMLRDGALKNGTRCWTPEIHDSSTGTIVADYGKYGASAPSVRLVNHKKQNDYQHQFTATGLSVTKGNKYKLTYKVWCNTARSITVQLQKNAPNWRTYGLYHSQWVGTLATQYAHTFTVTETASDAKLGFMMGDKTGSCWFDDVKLQDLGK